jgi:hypothetical protein
VYSGTEECSRRTVELIMVEACPVCDTLWRLYGKAVANLQELVSKLTDGRGQGDQHNVEILTHEVNIAESSVRAVGRELRQHEKEHHAGKKEQGKKQEK